MQLMLISAFAGISFGSIVYLFLVFFKRIELEKQFKEKMNSIIPGQKNTLGGIKGNMIFVTEKTGAYIKHLKIRRFDEMAEGIKVNFEILGFQNAKISPYTFIGIQFLSAAGAVAVALALLDIYNVVLLAAISVGGFYIPLALLKDKVKARHRAIFRQIPDVLDMLTLMIEAGLDFNSALNKVVASEKGPLIAEFAAAQQEVGLGKSRAEAFEAMTARIKYPPLNSVINSISLAIRTGGSMAPTLRALSGQFRTERSQLAEKLAAEAPVKLMGPLVLLIFPTIFIILFGPILLSFLNNG